MKRALVLSGGGGRGAFQVGVLKFLEEHNWKPDLICGSSAGAVNAVLTGSGLNYEQITDVWLSYADHKPYQFKPESLFKDLFVRRKFRAFTNTDYLRATLSNRVDIDALRGSRTKIIITAVNMQTSQLEYFDNSVISMDHIMAATAIPFVFPWQLIDGVPYWDGGVISNVPSLPALEYGIREILVVMLSPIGTALYPLPKTPLQVMELLVENILNASYYNSHSERLRSKEGTKITIVAPTRSLGIKSILNFSVEQTEALIREGYEIAKKQMTYSQKQV